MIRSGPRRHELHGVRVLDSSEEVSSLSRDNRTKWLSGTSERKQQVTKESVAKDKTGDCKFTYGVKSG